MLRIGKWSFDVDPERSKIVLTPRGVWSLVVQGVRKQIASGGAKESFAPKLEIKELLFEGEDWREFVGFEEIQEGAWRGEGEPEASLFVVQAGEIYETQLRITGHEGTKLRVQMKAIGDVFFDDDHDTDVPIEIDALVPFEGVRFRFRAEGVDSRAPERRAVELLSQYLDPEGFLAPEIAKRGDAGSFTAFFPPADVEAGDASAAEIEDVDPEVAVLHQSAAELVAGLVKQGWLELEDGGAKSLVPELVDFLELGGRGTERAERLVDWLIERDEVVDVHCTDEDLAAVLDKWW